jgi:hypothetical protein
MIWLITKYLGVEPIKIYSSFLIALGIVLPFLLIKKEIENLENGIQEIRR